MTLASRFGSLAAELFAGARLSDKDGGEGAQTSAPRRPSLPPALLFALLLWAGTALSFGGSCWLAPDFTLGSALIAVALAIAVLVRSAQRKKLGLVRIVIAGLLLGLGNGFVCGGVLANQPDAEGASQGALVLSSDGVQGAYGITCYGTLYQENGSQVGVRAFMPEGERYLSGRVYEVTGSLSSPSEERRFTLFSHGAVASLQVHDAALLQGEGVGSAVRDLRQWAIDILDDGTEGGLLLQAVLTGYRGELYDTDLYQAVKVDGLAHLVAVSGAHLVIVCSLFTSFLLALGVPRRILFLLQILLLGGYLVFTAFPPSALRAAIMCVLSLGAFLFGRGTHGLSALGVCLCVMIIGDGVTALSLSFLLSVSSMLGILVAGELVQSWVKCLVPRCPDWVSGPLSLTLSSNICTLPLSAALFSQVSLIAVICNIVAAPLFTLLCGFGLVVLCVLALLPLQVPLAPALLAFGNGACWLFEQLSCLPSASIPTSLSMVLSAALAIGLPVALWVVWPLPTRRRGVALVALCALLLVFQLVAVPRSHGDEIFMLDVGQGDAFVLRSGEVAVLIDTGTNDGDLLQGLARNEVVRLDAVIVTHPDDDHCGSLGALRGVVEVGQVLVAQGICESDDESCQDLVRESEGLVGEGNVHELAVGDVLRWGSFTASVLSPKELKDDGGNADSVVLLVCWDCDGNGERDGSGIFCGDAECPELVTTLEEAGVGKVNLLKVGHHGSAKALSSELIDLLQPDIALISVGANNRYGHPTQTALDLLKESSVRTYRTDQQGDVVCHLRSDGAQVSCLR